MENLIKIDDLGVPLFLETPICLHLVDGLRISTLRNGIMSPVNFG